jgi:hypothetical protein
MNAGCLNCEYLKPGRIAYSSSETINNHGGVGDIAECHAPENLTEMWSGELRPKSTPHNLNRNLECQLFKPKQPISVRLFGTKYQKNFWALIGVLVVLLVASFYIPNPDHWVWTAAALVIAAVATVITSKYCIPPRRK